MASTWDGSPIPGAYTFSYELLNDRAAYHNIKTGQYLGWISGGNLVVSTIILRLLIY